LELRRGRAGSSGRVKVSRFNVGSEVVDSVVMVSIIGAVVVAVEVAVSIIGAVVVAVEVAVSIIGTVVVEVSMIGAVVVANNSAAATPAEASEIIGLVSTKIVLVFTEITLATTPRTTPSIINL
jgi:hypothetical protein